MGSDAVRSEEDGLLEPPNCEAKDTLSIDFLQLSASETDIADSAQLVPPVDPSSSLNGTSYLPPLDFSEPPPLDSLQIDEVENPQSPALSANDFSNSRRVSQKERSNNLGSWIPLGHQLTDDSSVGVREEELMSGAKEVPKIESPPGEFFQMDVEVEGWFGAANVSIDDWLQSLEHRSSIHAKFLADSLIRNSIKYRNVAEVREHIVCKCKNLIQDPNWVTIWSFDKKLITFEVQTLLFFILCTIIHKGKLLLDKGLVIVEALMKQIAAQRWFIDDFDISDSSDSENNSPVDNSVDENIVSSSSRMGRLFFLTRLAILATFGGSESLHATQSEIWKTLGLFPHFQNGNETSSKNKSVVNDSDIGQNDDTKSITSIATKDFTTASEIESCVSLIKYAAFMEDVAARFPSFVQSEDDIQMIGSRIKDMSKNCLRSSSKNSDEKLEDFNGFPTTNKGRSRIAPDDSSLPDPRELLNSSSSQPVMPYVPTSIVEACNLYKSRAKITPAVLQLYEQYQKMFEAESHQSQNLPSSALHPELSTITCVEQLYKGTLNIQKSFVQVVIDFIIHHGHGPGVYSHAALATIWHLLQWFECTHILMFENLAALLFDCQFHLFAHMFCTGHSRVCQYALEGYVTQDFWLKVGGLSQYDGNPLGGGQESESIVTQYNKYNLQVFTHLMGICRLITSGKTQRLLVVAELPVDPYKSIFSIYEDNTWQQLLRYLKAQLPYTGRRWRYVNMEIISAIYLYVPSEVDDIWQNSLDVGQAIKSASVEEAALRQLIMNFNKQLLH